MSVEDASNDSSYRSWVKIKWEVGTNNYRRGHKGLVDVKCVTPADGEMYYRDHLPNLGNHDRLWAILHKNSIPMSSKH